MGRNSSRGKLNTEINAGSMADISFLLLLFFLVTTTIAEDKGVLVLLPPWSEEKVDVQIHKRNVFSVLVNANNQLLVRGQEMDIDKLKETAKDFIINPTKNPEMSESPQKAVISLKNDRGTKYGRYLEVYNELKAAYSELRNDRSQQLYGKFFDDLPEDQRQTIIKEIPLILSEAESTAYGEESK